MSALCSVPRGKCRECHFPCGWADRSRSFSDPGADLSRFGNSKLCDPNCVCRRVGRTRGCPQREVPLVAWLRAEGCHGADRGGLTPDAAVCALVAAAGLAVTVDEVAEPLRFSQAASGLQRPGDAHRHPHPGIPVGLHSSSPAEIRRHCFGGTAAIFSFARPLRTSGVTRRRAGGWPARTTLLVPRARFAGTSPDCRPRPW